MGLLLWLSNGLEAYTDLVAQQINCAYSPVPTSCASRIICTSPDSDCPSNLNWTCISRSIPLSKIGLSLDSLTTTFDGFGQIGRTWMLTRMKQNGALKHLIEFGQASVDGRWPNQTPISVTVSLSRHTAPNFGESAFKGERPMENVTLPETTDHRCWRTHLSTRVRNSIAASLLHVLFPVLNHSLQYPVSFDKAMPQCCGDMDG